MNTRKEIIPLANGLELVKIFIDERLRFEYQTLNGKRHGENIEFYENGQIRAKSNWNNGRQHGEEIGFYEDGKMKYKANWIEGVKNKTTFEYFKNGKIKKEITDLGKYEIKIREFYNNGNIRKQYYMSWGRKYGETIYDEKTGQLKEIC